MGSLNKYLFIFTMYKFRDDFLAVADSADLPWEVCAQTPDTATAHMEPTFANGLYWPWSTCAGYLKFLLSLWMCLRTFEPQDNFGKAFCDSPLMLYISQMNTFEVRKKKKDELGWNCAPEARLNSGHTSGFLLLDLSDSLQKSDRNTGSLLPMPPTSHVGNSHVVPNIAPVQRKLSQCFRRHGKPGEQVQEIPFVLSALTGSSAYFPFRPATPPQFSILAIDYDKPNKTKSATFVVPK